MRCILPMILASSCMAQGWTKQDIALECASQALIWADYRQTSDISYHINDVHEANTLLGRNPSQRTVNRYFIALSLGHLAISHNLRGRNRTTWQAVTISFSIAAVSKNANLGLRITW